MRCDEANQLISYQQQQFEITNSSLKTEINSNTDQLREENRKLKKTIQIMTRLSRDNYY